MKTRILPYLVIFFVSLLAAYWASMPTKKTGKGQVWLNLENKISTIEYVDSNKKISFDLDKGWIEEHEERNGEKNISSFKANKVGSEVLSSLERLIAIKIIGSFGGIDANEYGFDEHSGTLNIKTKSDVYRFKLGKRSFQTANLFAHDLKKDIVFLMKRRSINLLRSAKQRLFEKKIHEAELIESIEQLEITSGGSDLSLEKKGKSSRGESIWVKSDGSDGPEGFTTWFNRVLKLQVKRYATPDESQKLDSQKTLFSLSLASKGKLVEKISLYSLEKDDSTSQFWLKSSFTETFVLVDFNRAKTIRQDLMNSIMKD